MSFMLSPSQIVAVILAVASLILWAVSLNKNVNMMFLNVSLSILLVIAILALSARTKEEFFFEVSPDRQKCLIEQVAPTRQRTQGCCNKGYRGGNLPVYNDWITPNTFSGPWKRTDNLTLDRNDQRLAIQVPPTELVHVPQEEGKWIQENKKKKQRDLYTQQ